MFRISYLVLRAFIKMKSIWIIANWKSHKDINQALEWLDEVGPNLEVSPQVKVVVCPGSSCLSEMKKAITVGHFPILLGSQDISPFGEGAFTGEESARNLKNLIDISIIGHSERRDHFGETDQMVDQKVTQCFENNIIPLVCVQGVDTSIPTNCEIVAYEPIFAIGTGIPDTPENANKVSSQIKLRHDLDIPILYGGSVTSENAKSFLDQEHIEGLLIGGASLEAAEFVKIVQQIS